MGFFENDCGEVNGGRIAGTVLLLIAFVVPTCMYVGPRYSVWEQELAGEAELKKATWNRQIAIQEADAKKQAATMLAEAEVERAKGVAQANKIIGDSLHGNEDYLRYLWISGLESGPGREVIYVPTEANLPILEAQRLAPEAKK